MSSLRRIVPMAAAARRRAIPHTRTRTTLLVRSLATEAAGAAAATAQSTIKPPFDKILIANRGEIACRVMRTAQRLGVKCVAVYSEADRNSLHVKLADEAYCIGPATSSDSYLRMDKIIDVAKRTGAQAIHPGYGFLSENASFATELAKNDLVFIGPPASAIDAMGSKSESKKIMEAAGVPCVPGYHGDNQDPKFLKEQCAKIGYPVLIKAIKGGGGKGMRIVETEADFDMMLESAQREAVKAFGDGRVLVEKYLETPRHVEVQVFADGFGEAVYLFERDCSVQRRHQKTIEEAPAPDLSEEVRRALGEKAVAAAKAVNYRGAGTVEFIMDANTKQFYFMEMNTRLQVEHPVTEMITGTDLVEWQLQVAAGNPLPKRQSDLRINGWSFEARIYAENPANQFLPDTGPLLHMSTPEPSASVRVETGVRQGDEVSVFYDPMIAKAVVHGKDRAAALAKLAACLDEYKIVGLHTNIEFLKNLARHPEFKKGNVETGFIPKFKDDLIVPYDRPAHEAVMQAALAITLGQFEAQPSPAAQSSSPWTSLAGMRLNMPQDQTIHLVYGDVTATAVVSRTPSPASAAPISVRVSVPGTPDATYEIRSATYDRGAREMKLDLGTHRTTNTVVTEGDMVHVFATGTSMGAPQHGTVKVSFSVPEPRYLQDIHKAAEAAMGTGAVKTPMPCKIAQVLVKPGDAVKKGQVLVVLEAMKMEHVMRAPKDAVVERVIYKVGDLVEENKLLVGFKEE